LNYYYYYKDVLVHAMKALGGAEVVIQLRSILTSTQEVEVSGQLHAPAALPPGKVPSVPLTRRLDAP
jgi:hypothetical protein